MNTSNEINKERAQLRANRESNKLIMFFASEALNGMLSLGGYGSPVECAKNAFSFAQAMVEEYDKWKLPE